MDQAIELGLVDKRGAHLTFGNEKLGQGRERARETLLSADAVALALRDAVNATAQSKLQAQA